MHLLARLLSSIRFKTTGKLGVPKRGVRHQAGNCWYVDISHLKIPGDESGTNRVSKILLLEDGTPLNYPFALHSDIINLGEGRYSHWGNLIYFSSSTNDDPRINGRKYTIVQKEVFLRKSRKIIAEKNREQAKNCLVAVYDRSTGPSTFDFVNFLIRSEYHRIKFGLTSSRILFVGFSAKAELKSEVNEFNARAASPGSFDAEYLDLRFANITLPLTKLIPAVSSVIIARDRFDAQAIISNHQGAIYPPSYNVFAPMEAISWNGIMDIFQDSGSMPSLVNHPAALKTCQAWLRAHTQRPAISITLREMGTNTDRNSNLSAWAKAGEYLETLGFDVLYLRDSDLAHLPNPPELKDKLFFIPGSYDVLLRSAMYECCHLNLINQNGPAVLMIFNPNIRYIIFKMVSNSPVTSYEFLAQRGFLLDKPYLFDPDRKFQRVVWAPDIFDVIKKELDELMPLIPVSRDRRDD